MAPLTATSTSEQELTAAASAAGASALGTSGAGASAAGSEAAGSELAGSGPAGSAAASDGISAALSAAGRSTPPEPVAAAPARGKRASRAAGSSSAPKWLGKRIGRFRLVGYIGRGAMAKVFRAEDVRLHRLVALKVISSRSSRRVSASEKLDQLLREARSAAKLEHQNIVAVHEVDSSADIHFIAMELIEGGNLKDLVSAAGPLDVPRACQLCADAAEALQHAHEFGVIHRDVKPANLLLTRGGRCKLGDFGLAKIDDAADLADPRKRAVGTPLFVSPEVVQGGDATGQSDVYSLAGTLFYLLTGHPPFPGERGREVMRQHVEVPPPDVRTVRPEVPESLALAIWRGMAKNPAERYPSAGEFARVLRVHTIHVGAQPATIADDAGDDGRTGEPARATASVNALTPWADAGRSVPLTPRRVALGLLLGGGLLAALTAGLVVLSTRPDAAGHGVPNAGVAADGLPATTPQAPAGDDAGPAPVAEVPLPKPWQTIAAADTPSLLRVARETDPARHDGTVVVEGRVVRVDRWDQESGKRVYFRGVDRKRGFLCTIPIDALPKLTAEMGRDPADVLVGKRVRLTGTVDLFDGQPLVEFRSATQITLFDQ